MQNNDCVEYQNDIDPKLFIVKYLIILLALTVIVIARPWEISIAGSVNKELSGKSASQWDSVPRFATNLVISNDDSNLPETQKFDARINRFLSKWQIKGASFALMKDGKLLYSKGYGHADEEMGVKADVSNIFRIASVSKLITAVGIMKLAENGSLNLTDKVFGPEGILNDSLFSDIKDKRMKDITVEHLLRHQGGFSVIYGDPMFCPVDVAEKMGVPAPAGLNTTIQFVLGRRLRFTPGQGSIYSNVGYAILSKVIEKASGQDYEAYIRKNVLYPAGCLDMHLGHNLYENKFANEVKYYEPADVPPIIACDGSGKFVAKCNGGNNIEGLYGAGGWVASPTELLKLLSAIDGAPSSPDILKPENISYMTQYSGNALPIGWMNTNNDGDWWRTGTLSGTSALLKKQQDGYSWAFVTNTSTWQGSKFPHKIDALITEALTQVANWPERNLFDYQWIDHKRMAIVQ